MVALLGCAAACSCNAQNGASLKPWGGYFAPDDVHLMVSVGRLRLDHSAPVRNLRPNGTVLRLGPDLKLRQAY